MKLNNVKSQKFEPNPIVNMNRDAHVVKYMRVQLKGYKLLEELYRVPDVPHRRWMFDQINFKQNDHVLDYGCWQSLFWVENLNRLPKDVKYSLIDEAQINIRLSMQALEQVNVPFNISLMSFGDLNYNDEQFDVIVSEAGFMCMKADTQRRSLYEAHRVLKKDGIFYCLFRNNAMANCIDRLLHSFDNELRHQTIMDNYLDSKELINEKLSPLFNSITLLEKTEHFVVTDVKFMINFILNLDEDSQFMNRVVKQHKLKAFEDYLKAIIKADGGIRLSRTYYLGICKNKK